MDDSLTRPSKRGKTIVPEKTLFPRVRDTNQDAEEEPHHRDDDDHASYAPDWEYTSDWASYWHKVRLAAAHEQKRLQQQQQQEPPSLELSQLPEELLFRICGFLGASSLLRMRCLNRKYKALCARDQAGWGRLCEQLWADKVHVPAAAATDPTFPHNDNNHDQDNSMMNAFRTSLQDAAQRHWVTDQELCYDPATQTGTVWSFRFKESAGADWTLMDPWYSGRPCRKMVFLPNGTIKQYVDNTTSHAVPRFGAAQHHAARGGAALDEDLAQDLIRRQVQESHEQQQQEQHLVGNDHNNLLVDAFGDEDAHVVDDNNRHPNYNNNNNQNDFLVVDPPMSMTWRWITRPMDFPSRHVGSYVRITVGGRDVPTYVVRRSPTGNWGFVMESCWGLFASFELPERQLRPSAGSPAHRTRLQQQQQRRRQRRARGGNDTTNNNGMDNFPRPAAAAPYDPDQSDSEEEYVYPQHDHHHHGSVSSSSDSDDSTTRRQQQQQDDPMYQLRDDTYMQVTNEAQWREAFLYNIGARILPEGDFATNEFDRAWSGV